MNIEHLVLSGGGPIFGLYMFGVLNRLNSDNKFDIDKVKTIHGCSAGSILGALLCLKYDWLDLTNYIIGRPWDKIVELNPEDLFNLSKEKGILDRKFFEEIFNTLLLAKDLHIDITLKELYEYSNIDLHIYTAKINNFEYVDISYESHPEMKIIDAVYMSSAIPFIFKPVKYEDSYYIDGGVIKNFPFDNFMKANADTPRENILGILINYIDDDIKYENMSLMDYASFIYRNQMLLVEPQNYKAKHIIKISLHSSEVADFLTIFRNSSMRDEIINVKSIELANHFINELVE